MTRLWAGVWLWLSLLTHLARTGEPNSGRPARGQRWFLLLALCGLVAGCQISPTTPDGPRLLYIGWDEADQTQIYLALASPPFTATQLTQENARILDYAPAPDGNSLVYSRLRDDGGGDIRRLNLKDGVTQTFINCPNALCSEATWSPDGARLVYEQRALAEAGAPPGPPVLWWADAASGQTTPLFDDPDYHGLAAAFSPDGLWISFIAPDRQEIQLYELATGRLLLMPSQTGEAGAWSPDNRSFLFTQLQAQGETLTSHIISAGLEDRALLDLSGTGFVEDNAPAWSPDGQWIAFGRKVPRAAVGRQLYLVSPDGKQTVQLTDTPTMHHGPPAWSPDSQSLVFQRYDLTTQAAPGIWLLHLPTRSEQQVAASGIWPAWLP